MSKINLAPDASGTGIFTIASPNSNTNRTLTLPDDTGTIVTNSGNQAGSFTTLNTSGAVVFNDAGADVDFRVEGDTDANLLFVDASADAVGIGTSSPSKKFVVSSSGANGIEINPDDATTSTNRILSFNRSTSAFTPLSIGADDIRFYIEDSEKVRIDSSGNVLVGTTSASVANAGANNLVVGSGVGSEGVTIYSGNASNCALVFADTDNDFVGAIQYEHDNNAMVFRTNGGERMRMNSSGNLLVGKAVTTFSTAGIRFSGAGVGEFVASATFPIAVNRLSTDGTLISLSQGSVEEGKITVSGNTVSYLGGNLARWAQTLSAKDESLKKGTVLSNLDEMNVYVKPTLYWTEEDELPVDEEGNQTVAVGDIKEETSVSDNEQLNKVKVSDVEGDPNVAGVFVNWDYDEAHEVDEIVMAMTGDMIIRIAEGVTVARGDLLMSAGDGTAKPQGDDIVRSKTIAKVTSTHVTCTYDDGSYCVPCVLMAC